ncbi:MAG: MBL fold metallo-hydrolase [Deltaproteobacteria bacterium]|nr:MBL fold metallo-hydrolase [Deltaproteobacteria bacterium]
MTDSHPEVIRAGDENGNGMIVRITLSSGRRVLGLATRNTYEGDWDLGPTWNYVVEGDKALLVDTGRTGMGDSLLEMLASVGLGGRGIGQVILTHGHEDHDGGLYDVVRETGARVLAHPVYPRLIRTYPALAPSPEKEDFPASCWHCPMTPSFYREHCLEYHRQREVLSVETVPDGDSTLMEGVSAFHVPGHAPDALALLVDGEILLSGDTVLPQITPHPSQEGFFLLTGSVLDGCGRAEDLYGLRAYIRSLKRLDGLAARAGDLLFLPGHRLYYGRDWACLDLRPRIRELMEHHLQRCADLLGVLKNGPLDAKEAARAHFEKRLLKGPGMNMAVNEVLSHWELLEAAGDVRREEQGVFAATGRVCFEEFIKSL